MAVTRRAYIFGAFLLAVLSVLLIVVAISSDSWIVSSATTEAQVEDSTVRYGLFRGELILHNLATPTYNALYMTCVPEINACAVSCRTDATAREIEVRALANSSRPLPACSATTEVDFADPLPVPAVLNFGVYVSTLIFIFLQLLFAIISAGLTIINATMNPTEPLFGLPGCLWSNVVTSLLGLLVLMMFGIYWATSELSVHLAFSHIATGLFDPEGPALGYSYWLLIGALFCSLINIGLLQGRSYLLERDPPPPTIKLENHSDGTIFLY